MKLECALSFCKLVKLLAGGGTKIFRLLLEKLSAPFSFEDYMFRHQADIFNLKLTKDQKDLIIRREVEKMDITLLSKLLFKLFKDRLTQRQIELVNGLKNQRDLFVHSHILENAEMDSAKLCEKYDKIETLLLNLANEMGSQEVQNQMKDFILNLTNDNIDFEEIRGTLMEWFSSSDDKERDIGTLQKALDEMELALETVRLRSPIKFHGKPPLVSDMLLIHGMPPIPDVFYYYEKFVQEYFKMKERKEILRNGSSRDTALNYLNNSNLTLLQGDQGIGKTTVAFETADWLIERKQIDLKRCAMIKNPSDVKRVRPRDVDLLLIDGIGNKPNMVPLWEESLKYLENLLHGYNVKVIITTRTPINLEMKTQKGNFKLASKTVKLQCLAPFPGD